jgi:hypothetical protein
VYAAGEAQVDEIMARKKAKDAARERFKEYAESNTKKGTFVAGQTDYGAWELWCPSDEASAPSSSFRVIPSLYHSPATRAPPPSQRCIIRLG